MVSYLRVIMVLQFCSNTLREISHNEGEIVGVSFHFHQFSASRGPEKCGTDVRKKGHDKESGKLTKK